MMMKTDTIHIKRIFLTLSLIAAVCTCPASLLRAQDGGRIIFKDPKSKDAIVSEEDLRPRPNSWGLDVMIGTDGFGLGTFYGYTFNDEWNAFANLSFSEAKDARQIDYYDYWTGVYSPNKENYVFRIPLFFGLQYRLFQDEIADNFRPFISGGAGPVMLYITPAQMDFFTGLGHGHTKYTYGGFIGAGAQFGFDRSNVLGINVRYMMIPLPGDIRSVQNGALGNANSFFISINFGSAF